MQTTTVDRLNTYSGWHDAGRELLRPLRALMPAGAAQVALVGPPSDHDLRADRLEAFARPCLLAAFWMAADASVFDEERQRERDELANWFRAALAKGTDPRDPDYWGPNANYHQNGVEMGLLVIALEVAREWLWEPLDDVVKEHVLRWIASNRGTGHHWNNHFFFGVFCLEFLETGGAGRWSDRASIRHWFEEMEQMYRGQGWFMDGMNQSYDHYNAYAFHYYGPMWAHLYGSRDPEWCEKWKGWTSIFLHSYQHSFAASGEHPAFGRSISYRFNASAPFSAAYLAGANNLEPGLNRNLCAHNLGFFLDKPIAQEQGALSLGWHDHFPEVAEKYSCAGSVYWAAKAFTALLIPPTAGFWTVPTEPLPSQRGGFVEVVKPAGIAFRSVGGEVEILNAGSEICATNRDKFGPWKWGKLAYRSGVGFCLGKQDDYSLDMGLTALDKRTNRRFGRHYTVPLEINAQLYLCSYDLGDRDEQCNVTVETLCAWNRGWILQVHRCSIYQPTVLRAGGFALGSGNPLALPSATEHQIVLHSEGRMSVLQNLTPGAVLDVDHRGAESEPRQHVQAPYHATPFIELERNDDREEIWLAGLVWAGVEADASEAQAFTWSRSDPGRWLFDHPALGRWEVVHEWLPDGSAMATR